MNETVDIKKDFVGYEYESITVKKDMQSIYSDGYENFGWQLEDVKNTIHGIDSVEMKFKRDRKIKNKGQLRKLQREFDEAVYTIQKLENSKVVEASFVAYVLGVVGTAFMAGSVLSYVYYSIPLSIFLAIPGFIGWIIPYISYVKIQRKKTNEVTPDIDKQYDKIYEICEDANVLI